MLSITSDINMKTFLKPHSQLKIGLTIIITIYYTRVRGLFQQNDGYNSSHFLKTLM